jgi:hypothetical protein
MTQMERLFVVARAPKVIQRLLLCVAIGVAACSDSPPAPVEAPPPHSASTKTAAACDLGPIRVHADAVRNAGARWIPASGVIEDRSAETASVIWRACDDALPVALKAALDRLVEHPPYPGEREGLPRPEHVTDSVEAILPGHAATHAESLGDAPALRAVCPDLRRVSASLGSWHARERAAALFDGCKLGDVPALIVSRERWATTWTTSQGLLAVAVATWLREHGLGDDDARTIGQVLFRRAASVDAPISLDLPADLRLPDATRGDRIDDGVVVTVSPTAIASKEHAIAELRAGVISERSRTGDLVGPLFDVLAEEADIARESGARLGELQPPTLFVAADRDTPWPTMSHVLATAHAAGQFRPRLLVLVDDYFDPLRSLPLSDPLVLQDGATVADAVRELGSGSSSNVYPTGERSR